MKMQVPVTGAVMEKTSTGAGLAARAEENAAQAGDARLAWHSGYLHFDETALADAVASSIDIPRRIVIEDRSSPIYGSGSEFRATGRLFVQLLQVGLGWG